MIGDRIENELSVTRIFGDAGKPHIAVEPSTDIHLIRLGKSTPPEFKDISPEMELHPPPSFHLVGGVDSSDLYGHGMNIPAGFNHAFHFY